MQGSLWLYGNMATPIQKEHEPRKMVDKLTRLHSPPVRLSNRVIDSTVSTSSRMDHVLERLGASISNVSKYEQSIRKRTGLPTLGKGLQCIHNRVKLNEQKREPFRNFNPFDELL